MTENIKKVKKQYDFVGMFKPAMIASSLTIIIALIVIAAQGGINYNIEFNGGYQVQTGFNTEVTTAQLREIFSDAGMKNVEFQEFSDNVGKSKYKNEYVIKLESLQEDAKTIQEKMTAALDTKYQGQYEIRSSSFIGPKIGDELKSSSVKAFLIALFFILVYVSIKFRFKYAVASILAMIHDLIVTIGIYTILGLFTNYEISLAVVASILTVIGYSLNDTIVVFDRIRENIPNHEGISLRKIVNISVNETLSRTILTGMTTIFVIIVLIALGGEGVSDLAVVLLLGILTGTYSSIFVAAPIVIWWEERELRKKAEKVEVAQVH